MPQTKRESLLNRKAFHQASLLLIRIPYLKTKNRWNRFSWEDILKYGILVSFAGGVVWAEYFFFMTFWNLVHSIPLGKELILPRFFSLLGSFLFFFLLYSSFITALSSLFRSDDLGFLLASPAPVPLILSTKWFDVALRSGSTLVFLAIPPLVALGRTMEVPLSFYPAFVIATLALAGLAVTGGIWVAILLAVFFPVKRMHQTAAIVGLCIAAMLITGLRYLHLETLWSTEALSNPLMIFLRNEPSVIIQYGPGRIFTQAVMPFLVHPSSPAWLLGVSLVSMALFLGTIFMGKSLFLSGWWKTQEQADPFVSVSLALSQKNQPGERVSSLKTLMWKDWLMFKRDPSVWTQLFMMIPLAALYLLNLSFLPLEGKKLEAFFAVADVGLIGLIMAAIGARFLFPAASREGRAVWIPATAPLPLGSVIGQKMMSLLPPVLFLALILLVGSCWILNLSLMWWKWCLFYGLLLSLCICVLAICLGFCFPSYSFRHLLEVSLGKGAFLFMVISLIQIGWFLYESYRILMMNAATVPFLGYRLVAWILVSLGLCVMCYIWGKRQWRNIGEIKED